ncbi:MAG: hypothetical protein ITG02_04570 [Patulibacter sp.]|nr:hypothetical protein [Patulibacter sp.]
MSYDKTHDGLADDGAGSPLLMAIAKRWWLLLVLALVAGGIAAVGVANRTPSYEATAQILVTPVPQSDPSLSGVRVLRGSSDGARDLQTAAALLRTSVNDAETARRIGGGTTAEDVQSSVALEPLGGSNVINVTATATDPERAAALANAYVAAALGTRNAEVRAQARTALRALGNQDDVASARQQLRTLRDQGDPTVSVAQRASAPTGPSGPANWMIILAAIVAGLVLGVLGAVLLERVDRRVRDRGELLRRIPVPVLTGVPAFRGHAGIDMPEPVREAFRTLQIQLDLQDRDGCRRMLVTSPSSGDGKTTTVLNLAFALVGAGQRVIVVDFDLRRPELGRQLGLDGLDGMATSLAAGAPLTSIMRSAPRLAPLRLVQVATGAGDVALLPQLVQRMEAVLREAGELADYVLIDTAPLGEVGDALPLVEYVDDVLLVGRPGSTDRRSLDAMAGLFERAGIQPLGWVVANVDASASNYHERPKRFGDRRRTAVG